MELLVNIKYVDFEDKNLRKKTVNMKGFLPKKLVRNCVQIFLKRWTLDGFLRKFQTTGSIERTSEAVGLGRLKLRCFYVR